MFFCTRILYNSQKVHANIVGLQAMIHGSTSPWEFHENINTAIANYFDSKGGNLLTGEDNAASTTALHPLDGDFIRNESLKTMVTQVESQAGSSLRIRVSTMPGSAALIRKQYNDWIIVNFLCSKFLGTCPCICVCTRDVPLLVYILYEISDDLV